MKNRLALIAASVLTVGLLAGCTTDTGPTPTNNDPNHTGGQPEGTILLLDMGKLSGVPDWDVSIELPDGWEILVDDPYAEAMHEGPKNGEQITVYNESNGCMAFGSVEYYSAAMGFGRGDLYLSKERVYQFTSQYADKQETTVNILWDNQNVQFVSSSYDGTIPLPTETGEEEVRQAGYFAVRVNDYLVKNPYYFEGGAPLQPLEGTEPDDALPGIVVNYSCENPDNVNEGDWNKIVESLKLVAKP